VWDTDNTLIIDQKGMQGKVGNMEAAEEALRKIPFLYSPHGETPRENINSFSP